MCCGADMTKTVAEKLSDLVSAVRELPVDSQEVLVEEFVDRLADFTNSTLSDEQRAEIGRRLANPRYADPDKVRDFFARFGVQNG
jgi:putative addiction module component (TIGR02574 family)